MGRIVSLRIGLLLLAALPALSSAQGGSEDPILPEIPLTFRPPFSARYAGMGGVAFATADDQTAMFANPATLGLLRRIEFSAGFAHQDAEREVVYRGHSSSTEFGKTRLSHLGFAYPFPTYRGSLVVGIGYARAGGLDSDFFKRGPEGMGEYEAILEEGGLGTYVASVAGQVGPQVTMGGTFTILHGSSFRERESRPDADGPLDSVLQTTDTEFSGVTGTLGALIRLDRGIRLGFSLFLPEQIDAEGVDHLGVGDAERDTVLFSEEIDLPYRLGAGVALVRRGLILGVDAVYTDWTQIDYAGPLRTRDRRYAYRETLELRAGGEYLFDLGMPIRLRAGYLRAPLPYRLVLVDVGSARYDNARFDSDRHYFTTGLGILLAESFTLDAAYMSGGYERSSSRLPSALFREEERDNRLLATFSLRLR